MARRLEEIVGEVAADLGSPEFPARIDQLISAFIELKKLSAGLQKGPSIKTELLSGIRDNPSEVWQNDQRSREFDGTLKGLKDLYIADPNFLGLRFKTREHYMTLIKEIEAEFGDSHLMADLKGSEIQQFYRNWTQARGEAMAHSMMGMFRRLTYFGATTLRDEACERLGMHLHRMKFAVPKSSAGILSRDQANAIRAEAHKLDRASLALGQAFQFDCDLSQTDTIGQWVPLSEDGQAIVERAGTKWLRGLRWDEIDEHMTLVHLASKNQREVRIDLTRCPMVMEELALMFGPNFARADLPASGPVIVSEVSGVPWFAQEYRRYWRKAANLAGVPSNVKNYSSRTFTKANRDERGEN